MCLFVLRVIECGFFIIAAERGRALKFITLLGTPARSTNSNRTSNEPLERTHPHLMLIRVCTTTPATFVAP